MKKHRPEEVGQLTWGCKTKKELSQLSNSLAFMLVLSAGPELEIILIHWGLESNLQSLIHSEISWWNLREWRLDMSSEKNIGSAAFRRVKYTDRNQGIYYEPQTCSVEAMMAAQSQYISSTRAWFCVWMNRGVGW